MTPSEQIRHLSVRFAGLAEDAIVQDATTVAEVLSALLTTFRHISESMLTHDDRSTFTHNQNALLLGLADVSRVISDVKPPKGTPKEIVN